jgi:hypothetical protein
MVWERRGGWKGGRGCSTIGSPTSSSDGRWESCCVCSVVFGRMVVQVSHQQRKVTDGVSVICPNNRKRLTFVGQDAVGRQPSPRRRKHTRARPQWAAQVATSSYMLCLSAHERSPWPPNEPLQRTHVLLRATRLSKRGDVLFQNAKCIPTGSRAMAQEAMPHGATPLPCALGYRAAALRGKVFTAVLSVFGSPWRSVRETVA